MVMHGSVHSSNFDENTDSTLLTFTVVAYQWGWSYYLPADVVTTSSPGPQARAAELAEANTARPNPTPTSSLAANARAFGALSAVVSTSSDASLGEVGPSTQPHTQARPGLCSSLHPLATVEPSSLGEARAALSAGVGPELRASRGWGSSLGLLANLVVLGGFSQAPLAQPTLGSDSIPDFNLWRSRVHRTNSYGLAATSSATNGLTLAAPAYKANPLSQPGAHVHLPGVCEDVDSQALEGLVSNEVGTTRDSSLSSHGPMVGGMARRARVTSGVCLPSDHPLHLICCSKDVVHSWAIPGLYIKVDCIPGYNCHRRLMIR